MGTFNVGDKVAVISPYNGSLHSPRAPQRIGEVVRVAKGWVELDDNTKWRHDGYPHPKISGYMKPYIVLATQDHVEQTWKSRKWDAIERGVCELRDRVQDLSVAQLKSLHTAICDVLEKQKGNQ